MAFCPVVASSTSKTSRSHPGSSLPITLAIFESSSIRFFLLCNLPAVSQMMTSAFLAFPAAMVSYTTAAGSLPSAWLTISTFARFAHTPSCSMAAARKVSAAPRMTFFPSSFSLAASLPMEVVFPTPLTPITKTTEGFVPMIRLLSMPRISVTISSIIPMIRDGSVTLCSLTFSLSRPQILTAVGMPQSARIKISSSSSKSSSSIFVNEDKTLLTAPKKESLVFFRPPLILLNIPICYPVSPATVLLFPFIGRLNG